MKRIQTACLHQTIHFQLKDNVPAEIAQRLVREEEKEYQENLNRRGVPYRIWNREVLPDGSIRIRITNLLAQYGQRLHRTVPRPLSVLLEQYNKKEILIATKN